MNVAEKRDKIREFCDKNICDSQSCPLFNTGYSNGGICLDNHYSLEAINDMYHLIFENNSTNSSEKTDDAVNHPSHYTDGKIEVIEFIEDKKLGFCLGNAVKYIARAGKKDPTKEIEDLKKARWYIERRIKQLEEASV